MNNLPYFTGGDDSVRNKLNKMVDVLNAMLNMRGDETFIVVDVRPQAFGLKLNIDKVIERVPKPTVPTVLFPVVLNNPIGSAGQNLPTPLQADLVYDVYDLGGTLIKAGVTVKMARQYGHVQSARNGSAYYDYQGMLWIHTCDEVIDAGPCSE